MKAKYIMRDGDAINKKLTSNTGKSSKRNELPGNFLITIYTLGLNNFSADSGSTYLVTGTYVGT